MAFKEKFPIRSKIAVYKSLEQVRHFVFLGCDVSYEHDDGKNKKVKKYNFNN